MLLLFLSQHLAKAQLSTMAAGDYRAISTIVGNVATITPTIGNFVVGDQVLLIQMKGATIDVTNTINYGTISSLGNAGIYEVRDITAISGLNITLSAISRTYSTATGRVQLVRFKKSATSVSTPSSITAVAWNGTVGGVVAIAVTGTLTIASGHTINADGAGFRGGAVSATSNATAWCNFADFRSTNILTDCYTGVYAQKGEGIADDSPNDYARGAQASGGGGAGEHNAGGGGGSNLSAGGNGGKSITSCGIRRNNTGMSCGTPAAGTVQSNVCEVDLSAVNGAMTGGLGGKALSAGSANNRMFLGGGGGGGQRNGAPGSGGGNGGGIVFIFATNITNNSGIANPIRANGVQPALVTSNEGAGGGGAGGSVIMQLSSFTNAITIQAIGGGGGNTQTVNNECRGPGGGGGGGLIWIAGLSSVTNLTTSIASGSAGVNVCGAGCVTPICVTSGAGLANCATSPSNGLVELTVVLPVNYLYFRGKLEKNNLVYLNWATVNEDENSHFIIEKSLNGIDFKPIGRVEGQGNTQRETYYNFIDREAKKVNYYRLQQVDIDGGNNYSKIIVVTAELAESEKIEVFPNPATDFISIKYAANDKIGLVKLFDTTGKEIQISLKQIELDSYKVVFPQKLAAGMYMLQVYASEQVFSKKVYISE